MSIQGASPTKNASTPRPAHCCRMPSILLLTVTGCRPSEFPRKYTCSFPWWVGMMNLARKSRSGSSSSSFAANELFATLVVYTVKMRRKPL